jgi:hypothetical protein
MSFLQLFFTPRTNAGTPKVSRVVRFILNRPVPRCQFMAYTNAISVAAGKKRIRAVPIGKQLET